MQKANLSRSSLSASPHQQNHPENFGNVCQRIAKHKLSPRFHFLGFLPPSQRRGKNGVLRMFLENFYSFPTFDPLARGWGWRPKFLSTHILWTSLRKILVSVKFLSAILGPEMAAPILWTPGKMRSFCRKTHVHKIPRFFGGFWGGGSADFIFMGARIFLILFFAK